MNEILQGDCLSVLPSLPSDSVQCVITSPPYYYQRSYLPDGHPDKPLEIGLEDTPSEYVAKIVKVFREIRRVLRPDGIIWMNLGDSFGDHKQLRGMPWRVAFALQDDGWILRSDVIWSKTNALPESVSDRPTKSHEYLFLLSKSERYYYDSEAIKEPNTGNMPWGMKRKAVHGPEDMKHGGMWSTRGNLDAAGSDPSRWSQGGRNKRSVWSIPTMPYPGSHFAVMPPKLVEPCILAGSSPRACEHCLAPWERVTERFQFGKAASETRYTDEKMQATRLSGSRQAYRAMGLEGPPAPITIGWEPTCKCPDNTGTGKCAILDPFSGAGTVALVASQLGRNWLGIELNQDYITLAMKRLAVVQPNMWEVTS